ncbi:MAG: aminotransferase class I/II-fold pyridoxal phosphate-dependent enzyme [Promethearchaeota archaeon]
MNLISLGIGDPDIPTPDFILDEIANELRKPENHQYPSSEGTSKFRNAVSRWYKNRFNIELDAEKEISHVLGGKDGIANISRAFVNPGDCVLAPSPGYPVYQNGAAILNSAFAHILPLKKDNNFLPKYDEIPEKIKKKSKILYLNYPNNPTGAIATDEFLKETIEFALDNNIVVIYDNPYSEFTFGDYIAPTILQYDGGMECAIEINSCSKMFCMTGHRVGWAAGNAKIIEGLIKVKSNIDSGGPPYIQNGVVKGLDAYTSSKKPEFVQKNMKEYEKRMKYLVDRLNKMGWKVDMPKATFYLWAPLPEGETNSMAFTKKLIEAGVVITPGIGFGQEGEGFVRLAVTVDLEKLKEACDKIEDAIFK